MQSISVFRLLNVRKRHRELKQVTKLRLNFDSGMIYNRTKGTEFKGQAFPEFMQKLIAAGGLVNYTNSKKK